MRQLILAILLTVSAIALQTSASAQADDFIVAGYLPHYRARSWSPEQIGPVTDLILFAAEPTEDGSLDASDLSKTLLEKAKQAKQRSGCRLLLCVGGWERSNHFAVVVGDDAKRGKFVAAITAYCEAHELDGVDFDWEHPRGEPQIADFLRLLRDVRDALKPDGRIVTVAQSPWLDLGKPVYETVDRIHLMSYDHAFPQATLEKSQADVAKLREYGCPAEKIALGIPFYGRAKDWKARTYAQLVRGDVAADIDQVDGYAFNGRKTVAAKVEYARQQKLAGVMIWELGQDAPGERSLLKAIEQSR